MNKRFFYMHRKSLLILPVLLLFTFRTFADSLDYSKMSAEKLMQISRDLKMSDIKEGIRVLKIANLLPETVKDENLRHRVLMDLSAAQIQSGDCKSAMNSAYQ